MTARGAIFDLGAIDSEMRGETAYEREGTPRGPSSGSPICE
jgi:hypothetical protein